MNPVEIEDVESAEGPRSPELPDVAPPHYERFKHCFNNKPYKKLDKHQKKNFRDQVKIKLETVPRFWLKFHPEIDTREFFMMNSEEKLDKIQYLENLKQQCQDEDLPIPKNWINKKAGRTAEKWIEAPISLQHRWTTEAAELPETIQRPRNNDLLSRIDTIQQHVLEVNEALESVAAIEAYELIHYLVLLEVSNVSDSGVNGGRKAVSEILRDKTKVVVTGPSDEDKLSFALQLATIGLLNLLEIDPDSHAKFDYSLYTELEGLQNELKERVAARKRKYAFAEVLTDVSSEIESPINSPN
jgi:hypothetical protein